MDNSALQIFREGCAVLDPYFATHGFVFIPGESGPSSGGPFANGSFVNGDRRLELHYRASLGLVTYHFGNLSVDHEAYMWAILGPEGGNRYPGFSNEPLDAFEDLKFDLEHFASAFLSRDLKTFEANANDARRWRAIVGLARIP
jgi:hypothetical protein